PACRYCTDGCPKHISIPDLFAIMNTKQIHHDWNADCYYEDVHTAPGRKASDCLKCGKCEKVCPQHLPIRKLLEQVAAEFEKAPAAN
nr:4Fe-4S dicluster domain-containing protein [Oscillospiraceae bacterium]